MQENDMATPPNTYGGARAGAGRKPIPADQKASHRSITLPADLWAKVDRLRGDKSASAFLAEKVGAMREK
tara:strand:- start:36 stop:245 length:210 start_codon:yes stop_codon:yes gene_type:complete